MIRFQSPIIWVIGLTMLMICGSVAPAAFSLTRPTLASARSEDYQQAMQSGYTAAANRDYKRALENFQRALKLRPGDRNAQIAIKNTNYYLKNPVRSEEFQVPSGVGAPNERVRAATRGKCSNVSSNVPKLIAIIPENQLGLTSLEKPALLFYVPPTLAKSLQVRLQDDNTRATLYQRTLETPTQSGLAKFDFAEFNDAPSLELGKIYRWYLTLRCNPQDNSADVEVWGKIQRVELDPILASQLKKINNRDRANLYALNGLWYDAVKSLVEARQSNPKDARIAKDWAELLKSVELDQALNE